MAIGRSHPIYPCILGAISLLVTRHIFIRLGFWSDEIWEFIARIAIFGCGVTLLIIETRSKGISSWDSVCSAIALILMGLGMILLLEHHVF